MHCDHVLQCPTHRPPHWRLTVLDDRMAAQHLLPDLVRCNSNNSLRRRYTVHHCLCVAWC